MDGSTRSSVSTIQRPELPPLPAGTRAARGIPDPFRGPAAGTQVEGMAAPESVAASSVPVDALPGESVPAAVSGQNVPSAVQIVRAELPPTPPALTPLAVANKSGAVAAQEKKKKFRSEELRNAQPQDKVELDDTTAVPRPETPAAILALEQEKIESGKGRKNKGKGRKNKAAQAKSGKAPKKKTAPTKGSGSNPLRLVGALVVLALLAGLGFFASQFLGGGTNVSDLAAGECIENFFETDESGSFIEVSSLSTVACGEMHAYEVFAVSDQLFSSDVYPGVDASFTTGEEFCLNEYEEFIGGGRANLRTWEVWTFVPPEGSWSGDRMVQCVVGDINQATLVTGTLEGIATDS